MADRVKIRSLKKASQIVEIILTTRNPTLSDIAAEMELSRSTVYDYLLTLVELGYINREARTY